MNAINSAVTPRLRQLCELIDESGFSLSELDTKSGVSDSFLSAIRSGARSDMKLFHYESVLEALGYEIQLVKKNLAEVPKAVAGSFPR